MKHGTKMTHYLRHWVVLLMVLAFGTASAGAISQNDLKDTRISLSVREGKIIEIMNEVSSATVYSFLYEDGIKTELNKKIKIEHGENLHYFL
jgi:hypothetical protein